MMRTPVMWSDETQVRQWVEACARGALGDVVPEGTRLVEDLVCHWTGPAGRFAALTALGRDVEVEFRDPVFGDGGLTKEVTVHVNALVPRWRGVRRRHLWGTGIVPAGVPGGGTFREFLPEAGSSHSPEIIGPLISALLTDSAAAEAMLRRLRSNVSE